LPDGDAFGRAVRAERLGIGVDADELDPFEAEVNHRVDGVPSRATYTDDLDARVVRPRLFCEFDRKAHD
jgi:hypothetical protein